MSVPTLSRVDPAGRRPLLGLSYCPMCPIDNRYEETNTPCVPNYSTQERMHGTMGQRDICDLTGTCANDAMGQLGTGQAGRHPGASHDRPDSASLLHVSLSWRRAQRYRPCPVTAICILIDATHCRGKQPSHHQTLEPARPSVFRKLHGAIVQLSSKRQRIHRYLQSNAQPPAARTMPASGFSSGAKVK